MSIFGAGLLVGTALTVIIPEGIRSIYSTCHVDKSPVHKENQTEGHHHDHNEQAETSPETLIGLTLILGFIFMMIIDQVTHSLQHQHGSSPGSAAGASPKFFFLEDFPKSSGSWLWS